MGAPPLRENDIHLMDVISTSKSWTSLDKEIFNTVRQHLQVTTLAELRDNDGLLFHHAAFGQFDSNNILAIRTIFQSTLPWPSLA